MDETNPTNPIPIPAAEGSTPGTAPLYPLVAEAIEEVRPALQMDGGDIEFVGITPELFVKVRLVGSCQGCPSSTVTLTMGVENYIRERVPQIQGVMLDDAEEAPPPGA